MTQVKPKEQRGFSLVEVFIALAIGVFILTGLLSVFVGIRATAITTASYGELQENGRFAISLLTDDISKQDFWGDYIGPLNFLTISHSLEKPKNDCTGGGINNGSFPLAVGHFRTLWGQTVKGLNPMGCFNNAKIGSDVIQLKRVLTKPLLGLGAAPPTLAPQGNYHLVTNTHKGILFNSRKVPNLDSSRVWQYQHHVYYIKEEKVGSYSVPVLMQGRLTKKMSFSPIIEGIEMIRFMYGYDHDSDPLADSYGVVDAFISADNMTDRLWDNAGGSNIIAIKIYVLVRNIKPDNSYDNTNTYLLGDLSLTFNDHYRRLLFSTTVTLYNTRIDLW